MAPNTARNWRKERFRKYMKSLPSGARVESNASVTFPQRRRGAGISAEKTENERCEIVPFGGRGWRTRRGRSRRAFSSLRFPLRLRVSAGNWPLRASRDASHADQVSENDAFQGLRGGHSGVAAAAAHRHGLQPGTVFVEGARVPPAGVVVEIQ